MDWRQFLCAVRRITQWVLPMATVVLAAFAASVLAIWSVRDDPQWGYCDIGAFSGGAVSSCTSTPADVACNNKEPILLWAAVTFWCRVGAKFLLFVGNAGAGVFIFVMIAAHLVEALKQAKGYVERGKWLCPLALPKLQKLIRSRARPSRLWVTAGRVFTKTGAAPGAYLQARYLMCVLPAASSSHMRHARCIIRDERQSQYVLGIKY